MNVLLMCYEYNGGNNLKGKDGENFVLINGKWIEADKVSKINETIKNSLKEEQQEGQLIKQEQPKVEVQQQKQNKKEEIQVQKYEENEQKQSTKDQS